MSLQEVREFFSTYNAAFDALDGDAVAELWHCPSAIADDKGVTWWSDQASVRDNMVALCGVYRNAGYARALHNIQEYVAMGKDTAFVTVAWTIEGKNYRVLQSFHTGYNLQRFTDHLNKQIRVVFCTAYEENLNEIRKNSPSLAGEP